MVPHATFRVEVKAMEGGTSLRGSALPPGDWAASSRTTWHSIGARRSQAALQTLVSLAVIALFAGILLPGLAPVIRWLPLGLTLVPPGWAWIAEQRVERRMVRQVYEIGGVSTAQPASRNVARHPSLASRRARSESAGMNAHWMP